MNLSFRLVPSAALALLFAAAGAFADAEPGTPPSANPDAHMNNKTSTGHELTGPGTHPGEYLPGTSTSTSTSTESRASSTDPNAVSAPAAGNPDAHMNNKTSTGHELTGPGTHPGEYLPNGSTDSAAAAVKHTKHKKGSPKPPKESAPRSSVPETPQEMPGNGSGTMPGSGGSMPGTR